MVVGFIDDYMKTRKQNSAGLGGWAKIVGQIVIAVTFALLGLQFANENGVTPASTQISSDRPSDSSRPDSSKASRSAATYRPATASPLMAPA